MEPIMSWRQFYLVCRKAFKYPFPEMVNPIPAGIIETTNRLHVPISLDISYIAAPNRILILYKMT